VSRAVARAGLDPLGPVDEVFAEVDLIELDSRTIDRARRLLPTTLRALDAIHLAAALEVQPQLDVFVTYDQRLFGAVVAAGLKAISPA
jgi:uncharacterized protein